MTPEETFRQWLNSEDHSIWPTNGEVKLARKAYLSGMEAEREAIIALIGDNQRTCFCEEGYKCEYCKDMDFYIAAIRKRGGDDE